MSSLDNPLSGTDEVISGPARVAGGADRVLLATDKVVSKTEGVASGARTVVFLTEKDASNSDKIALAAAAVASASAKTADRTPKTFAARDRRKDVAGCVLISFSRTPRHRGTTLAHPAPDFASRLSTASAWPSSKHKPRARCDVTRVDFYRAALAPCRRRNRLSAAATTRLTGTPNARQRRATVFTVGTRCWFST